MTGDGTLSAYTKPRGIDNALVAIIELAEGAHVTGRLLPGTGTHIEVGQPGRWLAPAGDPEDSSAVLTFVPAAGRSLS